jgi:uncharacterized protein (TIGR01777 family)
MYTKIIIAGGSGFIGTYLSTYFSDKATEVHVIQRRAKPSVKNITYHVWDGISVGKWCECLENADLLINLTGKSVNCRYTEKAKYEIIQSRVLSTKVLGQAIKNSKNPPKYWFNSSSATIYPNTLVVPNDESFTDFANDFSVQVCKIWEKTFHEIEIAKTKKVTMRMSIVLGKDDGVFPRYKKMVQFGLGGYQGTGKQQFSWIHILDLCRAIEFIYNNNVEGIVNFAAPNPITNSVFMKTIRKINPVLIALPMPIWMVHFSTWLIGSESELLLKSRCVISKRLKEHSFEFNFDTIEKAVKEVS